jgi:Predicted HD superfamily hydrolase
MASFLKRRWTAWRFEAVTEFYTYIGDLLAHEDLKKLDDCVQHHAFSRLHHSLDVAFYSFLVVRFLRWDCRSTARGALLHDLYFHDWRTEAFDGNAFKHLLTHPRIALENARKIADLNAVEENIILRHMWLLTLTPPRYKEGFVVTFVDKYCATHELLLAALSLRKELRRVEDTAAST